MHLEVGKRPKLQRLDLFTRKRNLNIIFVEGFAVNLSALTLPVFFFFFFLPIIFEEIRPSISPNPVN